MSQTRSVTPAHFVAATLVFVATVWLVIRQRYYAGWVDDDAFITFRYARNLAEGHGLVFNVGERVEGYTNFLWTVILAALYKLGADLPSAARALGAVCSVSTAGVVLAFARTRAWSVPENVPRAVAPVLAVTAAAILCVSDSWAAWAAGGLENTLSALLVTAAFLAYVRAQESGSEVERQRALLTAAVTLALAILNHPANALFVAPILLDRIVRRRAHDGAPAGVAVLVFVTIVGVWTAWRLWYYGDILPNTFHAKVGFTRFVLQRGVSYFGEVLRALPLAYAAVLGLGILSLRRPGLRRSIGLPGSAVALHTAYVVGIGGEQFPALRSVVVVLPLLALLMQSACNELCRSWMRGGKHAGMAIVVATVAFVGAGHAVILYVSPRIRVLDRALDEGRTALSTAAAMRLKELLPRETLFAHSGAGLIAFYTNFPWIDTLGLTDRHIARTQVDDMGRGAAGHEKGDGAYVWSRRPDYVMFPGYPISNRTPGTKGGRELVAIPEFSSTYRPVRLPFEFQGPHDAEPRQHVLFLWQRIGAPPPSGG